ncbi:unnamed protein product [Mytilus edulis]|uniref:Uncharacterized protein n=1 Tax=Mytilus edulis TaxID=6550 RepID=A0A8S3V408_MYTED|nr:unnamed protein product [Mytilus edulis]
MDQSQQNYLRIVAVVNGPGLNAVRCFFDRCFPPNLLNTQLSNSVKEKTRFLETKESSDQRSVVDRLGDAILKQQCELLERAELNMAYKVQCEELSRNIATLKEHETALEARQDQLASDLMKHETISRANEDIIKQIIEDIKSKNEEAACILERRMQHLKNTTG